MVEGTLFPCYGDTPQVEPQVGRLLLGEALGGQGRDFTRQAVEELTAWGKSAYRVKDNTFVPMLTDGTNPGCCGRRFSGGIEQGQSG